MVQTTPWNIYGSRHENEMGCVWLICAGNPQAGGLFKFSGEGHSQRTC